MSTTETKRDIIDYLWEWAESAGNWAKLLVKKVVQKEGGLVEDERTKIYSAFIYGLGLGEKGKEAPEITRPTFSASEVEIELIKVGDVCGVNRLASGQSLEFSPNMTVVYGENGAGKTGYGRVLKNFGYCYDSKVNIHPDVDGDCDCKQSALIDYKAGGSRSGDTLLNSIEKLFTVVCPPAVSYDTKCQDKGPCYACHGLTKSNEKVVTDN